MSILAARQTIATHFLWLMTIVRAYKKTQITKCVKFQSEGYDEDIASSVGIPPTVAHGSQRGRLDGDISL